MKKIMMLSLTAGLLIPTSHGERKNSITGKLKPGNTPVVYATVEPFDTIVANNNVKFSGYEKTLRSLRETMFVTNTGNRIIEAVYFHITYFDSDGRQLHQASVHKSITIPVGETRKLDIPSWDRQCTFYYVGSPRPRVSAIPYSVAITPDTLLLLR
jgi:hypothetical protein